jgi:sugar/nucleoside kinase (ribokinase family)
MEERFDVAAIGTLNVDLIILGEAPRELEALQRWMAPSRVELAAAGSVGYCVVDMARLGLRVSLLSTVADDFFGEWILRELRQEGIDVDGVSVEPGAASGIGIYMLLFGNPKRPLTGRLATHAAWPIEFSASQEARLKRARWLHCGGYLHYQQMWGAPTEDLYRRAKGYGLTTSVDTQFPLIPVEGRWMQCFGSLLDYVDVLFTDEDEAKAITGAATADEAVYSLLEAGPSTVVVKSGARGALVGTSKKRIHQPAFPVADVQDSIGAGDAFDAGMIYGLLAGWSPERSARFASAAAAMTLAGIGGSQTAPNLAQVEDFLAAGR